MADGGAGTFTVEEGRGGPYVVWHPEEGPPVVLGSKFNAADHARRTVRAALTHPQQGVVVVSPGFTGLDEAAAAVRPGSVLLVEANAWLAQRYGDRRIGFPEGTRWLYRPGRERLEEEVLTLLAPGAPPPAVVWAHPRLADHPDFQALAADLQSALAVAGGYTATLEQAGRFFLQNLLDNAPTLVRSSSLEPLRGALRGRPAVLLGAGPSLEAALPLLQQRPDLPVFAVDMAFLRLLAMGRPPDLLATVDPYLINAMKVHPHRDIPVALVCSALACPGVVSRFAGPVYGFVVPPFRRALGLEALPVLEGMGAVGAHLMALGLLTGADPLIVAGLDFAFVDGGSYAKGNFKEGTPPPRATVQVMGMAGDPLPSLPSYRMAVRSIGQMWAVHAAPPEVWNLGRGAKLPGATLKTADEVLALPPQDRWEPPPGDAAGQQWQAMLMVTSERIGALARAMAASGPTDELCAAIDGEALLHLGLGQLTGEVAGRAEAVWPRITAYVQEVAEHCSIACEAF